MARKQTRRSVSVSQDFYVAFAASCAGRGVSMSQQTERLISAHLEAVGTPSAEAMRAVRERMGKVGKGAWGHGSPAPHVRSKPPAVPLDDRVAPDPIPPARPRCVAIRGDRSPCPNAAAPGKTTCRVHASALSAARAEKVRAVAEKVALEPRHATPIVDRLADGRTHVPAVEYEAAKRAVEAERTKRAPKPATWSADPPKTIRSRADRIAEDAKQIRRTVAEVPASVASGRPGPTKPDPLPDRGSVARSLAF